ncbi:YfcC family protein [Actinomyces sp. zg-332]|uniref:YfcC family protein n=1 Tax=Actinomyces sp. zg-332 TaxID=2708340 RepID=UPI00141F1D8C|nr:YfcC family protein [Actinomyces sp. zg-332]QPK94292.1 YfcC family protein [Actinomyces sp. zg-332]
MNTSTNTPVSSPPPELQETGKKKKKRGLYVPTAFTILFVLTFIAVIATWFVPAGQYSKLAYDAEQSAFVITEPSGKVETVKATQAELDKLGVKIPAEKFTSGDIKKPISIPDTYKELPSNPASISKVPIAMVNGTMESIDIMVFIFVLGGLIGVVRASGAFDSGLIQLTKKTKGNEFILVFAMSIFMVVGGTLCGLEEEAVAFYPIMCPIFIALGYDAIISVGAIFLAGSMGTTFSTINPFSAVIASNAAGVSFTEGLWWRTFGCVVGAIVVIGYLYWYAKKIKKDPTASYTYEDHKKFAERWGMSNTDSIPAFDWRRKVILLLFFIAFPIMVWGVMAKGWYFPTMASSFLTITMIVMVLAATGKDRLNEKQLVDAFSEGASSLVAVSLIIGLARGINLVLNEGLISDTMLHAAVNVAQGMNGPVFIIVMLLIFFVLGFVVPSSSGLAVLSMPIMAPLADTVGIPRWIIVCAYQWGQYAMLFLAPTGLVMATLQMLDMKYSHWFRFVWPMVAFVLVFGGGMLVTQTLIYGQ